MQIRVDRFGGIVNPDNSINLFVIVNLSHIINDHTLTKTVELMIPINETEIYNLVYQLQPLVYLYCESIINSTVTE